MANEEAIALVRELWQQIQTTNLPVEDLILFGSMARGDERKWSDIDVLALVNDSVKREDMFDTNVKIQHIASKLDARMEVLAIHTSRYESDDPGMIGSEARREGIRVAA